MSSDGSLMLVAVVPVSAIFGIVLHELVSCGNAIVLQLSTSTEICRLSSFASNSQPVSTVDYSCSREGLLQQAAEDIKQIANVH